MSLSPTSGVVTKITLPSPNQLRCHDLPLDKATETFIKQSRRDIASALDGHSDKIVCVVGPCSVHDVDAALHYARELIKIRNLLDKTPLSSVDAAATGEDTPGMIGDNIVIVMRVYCEKPRTGLGWKGLLRDPHLDGSNDMSAGIHRTRELLLTLNGPSYRLPCAVEFLDPLMPEFISDLVSWAAIGARTAESQIHREMVSGLVGIPVGFKNSTCGAAEPAVHSIVASAAPHTYTSINADGHVCVSCTPGNPLCHLVLRGGRSGPNYTIDHLKRASETIAKVVGRRLDVAAWSRAISTHKSDAASVGTLTHPMGLVVDCSHGNCNKDYRNQSNVATYLSEQLACTHGVTDIGWLIRGVMIESFINEGNQKLSSCPVSVGPTSPIAPTSSGLGKHELQYGVSITDGCISIAETERLLRLLAEASARRTRNKIILGSKRPRE